MVIKMPAFEMLEKALTDIKSPPRNTLWAALTAALASILACNLSHQFS